MPDTDLTAHAKTIPVLGGEIGYVRLIDVMPRLVPEGRTGDLAIVEAARVSTNSDGKIRTPEEDRKLIRYLMRHRHTSPFEMVEFKFEIKCPIFVARQWMRHRTASINEISGRYCQLSEGYYTPDWHTIRSNSPENRQATSQQASPTVAEGFSAYVKNTSERLDETYNAWLAAGVSREQARMILPLTTMTRFVWKIDLHNLLNFLELRLHEHSQYEIRVFASAIEALILPIVPYTIEAFYDFRFDSVTLSAQEIIALREPDAKPFKTPREESEWNRKKKVLFPSSAATSETADPYTSSD